MAAPSPRCLQSTVAAYSSIVKGRLVRPAPAHDAARWSCAVNRRLDRWDGSTRRGRGGRVATVLPFAGADGPVGLAVPLMAGYHSSLLDLRFEKATMQAKASFVLRVLMSRFGAAAGGGRPGTDAGLVFASNRRGGYAGYGVLKGAALGYHGHRYQRAGAARPLIALRPLLGGTSLRCLPLGGRDPMSARLQRRVWRT